MGGVVLIFIAYLLGYKDDKNIRWLTLVIMGVNLILAVWLYAHFDPNVHKIDGNDGYQFIERGIWIRSLNVENFVGIDAISVTMVLLTALISFVGLIATWSVDKQLTVYFAMYCLLVTGSIGAF